MRPLPNSCLFVSREGFLWAGEPYYGNDNGLGYMVTKRRGNVTECVHRLIAEAFVPNPRPDIFTQVDHINRVRDDNRACNLRWVSPELNALNKKGSQVRMIAKWFNRKTRRWIFHKKPVFLGYYGQKRVTRAFGTHAEAHAACSAWRAKMFFHTYEMLTSGPVCAFFAHGGSEGRRSSRS